MDIHCGRYNITLYGFRKPEQKFTFIILLATLSTLIPYLFSTLARLKFIYANRDIKIIVRLSVMPAFAFVYSVWAVMGLGVYTILWGLVFLCTGIPVYLRMKRMHAS
jgi:amino acid transporter